MNAMKTIAGFKITLESGKRYIATRQMNDGKRKQFTVSIMDMDRGLFDECYAAVFPGLKLSVADDLINSFNNEEMSLSGRLWD